MNDYPDKHGIAFAKVRQEHKLPENCSLWHPITRVQLNSKRFADLMGKLHQRPGWGFCWACGRRPPRDDVCIQIHHIGSNGATRSDEETCLIPLCWAFSGPSCHPAIAGNLSKVLGSRWRWGRESLCWERLILCQGYWPDAPTRPKDGADFWLPGFVERTESDSRPRHFNRASRMPNMRQG